MEAPTFSKRQKLGKNKKKSWRGIDITATEEFLEDQRFQQRTTGLVADKTNDELFAVERRSDKTAGEARKRKAETELTCYSILINRSKTECPRKQYPPTREGCTARTLRAFTPKGRSPKQPAVVTNATKKEKDERVPFDLWGEEKKEIEGDDFFNEITKRKRVKPPRNMRRKCSERKVVEVPHPGASVNPAYDDHQDLLLEAHAVELKKEKAERKIFNALDACFPAITEAPSQDTWMQEMSTGLYEDPNDEEDDEEEKSDSHISINPPVSRDKKKTPRERRKAKAAKLQKHVMAQKKTAKGTENKVYSEAKIRSELAKEKRESARRAKMKAQKEEAKKHAPKKLGKLKVEVPDLELKLSSELVGSLRSVKPEGHLLEDRYKSLQMRNLIEPRAKAHKKKTKTKKFEKKSFREITV